MGKVTADIVTVSHDSPNHCFVGGLTGEPRTVEGPGEYEIAEVLIGGVATGAHPGVGPTNTAYTLRFDDLAICHLGDLNGKLSDAQVEELGSIDVLLVPVGGGGALSATAAAEVVAQLEPSLVIPMHFSSEGKKIEGLEPVDHFVREMGAKDFVSEPKVSVTRSSLPSEVRVAVLARRNGSG